MTVPEIVAAIARGDADGHGDEIVRAVRERLRLGDRRAQAELLAALPIDALVQVTPRVSPRYLMGQRGTVVRIDPRRGVVTVRWVDPNIVRVLSRDRFGLTGTTDLPAAGLERV